jgi:hypothetical protein
MKEGRYSLRVRQKGRRKRREGKEKKKGRRRTPEAVGANRVPDSQVSRCSLVKSQLRENPVGKSKTFLEVGPLLLLVFEDWSARSVCTCRKR